MCTEDLKTLVRRYYEEENRVDWATHMDFYLDLISDEIVWHFPEPAIPEGWANALPDHHCTVDCLLAEGEMVTAHWTLRGKHTGDYAGLVPTGKEVQVSGVGLFRFVEGKVVEHWKRWDGYSLLVQLGMKTLPAS